MDFSSFDETIGADKYYKYIERLFFPKGRHLSKWNAAVFSATYHTHFKGAFNIRIRKLELDELSKFMEEEINVSEFFAPPVVKSIGRYNGKTQRVLYLSSRLDIAMKECEVEANNYFLVSKIGFTKKMRFFSLNNEFKGTQKTYDLLHSKDKKFYPVINKVITELLTFPEMDGFQYDPVTTSQKSLNNVAPYNLAIHEENFEHTYFHSATLFYLTPEFKNSFQFLIPKKYYSLNLNNMQKVISLNPDEYEKHYANIKSYELPVQTEEVSDQPLTVIKII